MTRRSVALGALLLGLATALAQEARAQEAPPEAPPPAPAPSEVLPPVLPPPAPPPAAMIPDGVTIAGIPVGGMTAEQAKLVVQGAFDQPLELVFHKRRWRVWPDRLGAKARVDGAVARALGAVPSQDVELVVTVRGAFVRDYVRYLDGIFSRPARDSRVRLIQLRPRLTKPIVGFRVTKGPMAASLVRALFHGERGPIPLEVERLAPEVTLRNFGPVILIRRETKKLVLFRGQRVWKRFRVATGQAAYPTPLGRFEIAVKWRNPWWYPPDSAWARGQKPVPPGPGNPLGTRWMGLTEPLVGIHGTPDAASIGYSASHGCIRMRIPDAEWLFEHVGTGTPVFIVPA